MVRHVRGAAWPTGTAYEEELHRGWEQLPHDENDMVRTQDLLQHIIKVSRGQGTQDQDIKYEHMVRELGNISKTVLQHSGDPGLRLCSCVSVLASRFLLGLATPTHRLARVSHFASCPCPASPAAFACRRHWLARSCPCPAVSASQPGHVCVFVCGCTCGMQMRDRGGGGKDRRKDDEARVLCLCCR